MPTGYTAGVGDGTVTDFTEYAMNCARAFGSLVMMRDDPIDAPIPEKLEPSTYNAERLVETEEEFRRIGRLTNKEADKEAEKDYDEKLVYRARRKREQREIRERYERMVLKARAFRSPSPEHDNYAKFLVSQLTESIEWDCHEYDEDPPKRETGLEWRIRRNEELDRESGYTRKANAKEIQRTNERNEWLEKLRAALNPQGENQ